MANFCQSFFFFPLADVISDTMSVLLSDISSCTNSFSRILFSPNTEWSLNAEVTGVNKAGSAFTQHTEYQITVTVKELFFFFFVFLTYSPLLN